jgi:transcriptional repressor NrdR
MEDRVMESRTLDNGESIRRRRECNDCGYRFTSYEVIEEKPLMVLKRDGRWEPFSRSKLEKGIVRALEKRPVSGERVENLLNEIVDQVFKQGRISREINTTELGELGLEKLFAVDKVGYVRFASVYRHFEEVDEFVTEIKRIRRRK